MLPPSSRSRVGSNSIFVVFTKHEQYFVAVRSKAAALCSMRDCHSDSCRKAMDLRYIDFRAAA